MAPPSDPDYAREKEARRKTRQEKRRNEALGARNDAHNHVLREDVDALRAAAAAGLDLEDVDDDGCSPAYFAVCRDSGAMLDALAACGVDLGDEGAAGDCGASLASLAATRGCLGALRALDGRVDLARHAGRDGWTAAGAAALQGRSDALDALHGLGVDLAAPCNRHGEAPLAVARKVGHARAAESIRRALADVASRDLDAMPE